MSPQERAADGLDAKRRRLADLESRRDPSVESDLGDAMRARVAADDLRREIARAERGDDGGKVDLPEAQIRDQVMQTYARLASQPGGLVSLAILRANLPHIKYDQLTAALKRMDRERVIHLDPDSNRKALPPEAHEAAVTIGGEPKHFISARR